MHATSIAGRRLAAQELTRATSGDVRDVVRRLGAVQAQDYGGAKWALAQRVATPVGDADVDRAYDAGTIVRTHLLRPTWHFVAAEDLRWLLALSAPRVRAAMARRRRQLGLDDVTVGRAEEIVARALEGAEHLTRPDLMAELTRAGTKGVTSEWATHLMLTAELDGVVCSGPRRGKLLTYALLDERVPAAGTRDREEALVDLARRYFTTRGPATLADWSWWSGLTVADGKRAVAALGAELAREEIDGVAYWSAADAPRPGARGAVVHLLPPYDELFIGHRDRGALLVRAPALRERWAAAALTPVLAVNGQLVGVWSRATKARSVVVRAEPLVTLTTPERRALDAAVARYGEFLGMEASLA